MNNPYRSLDLNKHPKKWPWKRWLWSVSLYSIILSTIGLIVVGSTFFSLYLISLSFRDPSKEKCKSYVDSTNSHSKLECDHPDHKMNVISAYAIECICTPEVK